MYDDFKWKNPFGLHGLYKNMSALHSCAAEIKYTVLGMFQTK